MCGVVIDGLQPRTEHCVIALFSNYTYNNIIKQKQKIIDVKLKLCSIPAGQ